MCGTIMLRKVSNHFIVTRGVTIGGAVVSPATLHWSKGAYLFTATALNLSIWKSSTGIGGYGMLYHSDVGTIGTEQWGGHTSDNIWWEESHVKVFTL